MFRSIPFEPRELRASDEVLEAIYQAAKLGIKGDALAFAAGLLPIEYRRLQALDTRASIAEAKGRADSEVEVASAVRTAALEGDTKAGLALLSVLHEWVPKQQINVDIKSQISITEALREAERRVIEGRVLSSEDASLEPMVLESPRATAHL